MIGDKIQNNSGFSLIEMVVAVSIFVMVILMVTSIFQNSIIVQKNSIATQTAQEGMRYALEVLSKEIRSAVANINPGLVPTSCVYAMDPVKYKVYNYNDTDKVLYFRNRLGECVYYSLAGNRLFKDRINSVDPPLYLPITPVDIKLTDFDIALDDDEVGAFHSTQPNVTLFIDVESDMGDFGEKIKLQTSISSRHYE